jgi:hypothetical protein
MANSLGGLNPICEELQALVSLFESGQFRVIAVAYPEARNNDCTGDHVAALNAVLSELRRLL